MKLRSKKKKYNSKMKKHKVNFLLIIFMIQLRNMEIKYHIKNKKKQI